MNSILSQYHQMTIRLVPWLAAALVLIAIVSPSGSQPVAALLFLISLPLLFVGRPVDARISNRWIVFLLLPLLVSIPLFIKSGTGEALAGGARYFLALITLVGISRLKLDAHLFLRAASGAGILAILWNIDQLGEMRVNWGVGYLDSGYVSVMLLALALAQFHCDRFNPAWRIFAALGVACLVVAVMKTGTRGAWPAMIVVFLLQFTVLEISRTRKVLIAFGGLVLFAVAVFTIPSVKHRIDLTLEDIESYYTENNHANSMGYRLDFWHIALDSFVEGPLFGVSYQRRGELMDKFTVRHPESTSIGHDGRSSSHNEILNALSKKGILGGVAILLLYLVPMRYFIARLRRRKGKTSRNLALGGIGVVMTMLLCGITEAPIMNVRVGATYGFILILLYHLISISPIYVRKAQPQSEQNL